MNPPPPGEAGATGAKEAWAGDVAEEPAAAGHVDTPGAAKEAEGVAAAADSEAKEAAPAAVPEREPFPELFRTGGTGLSCAGTFAFLTVPT